MVKNNQRHARNLVAITCAVILCVASFGYGALVGKYEVFPHDYVASFKHALPSVAEESLIGEQFPAVIQTAHEKFDVEIYNFTNSADLSGWGGGVFQLDGKVVGVDRSGHFFIVEDRALVRLSAPKLTTNEGELTKILAKENNLETVEKNRIVNNFGVLDVVSFDGQILISHNIFDINSRKKQIAISRINAHSLSELVSTGSGDISTVTLLDAAAALFDLDPDSSFRSNRLGGGLVISGEDEGFLLLGDQQLDGLNGRRAASQEDGSLLGKALKIELSTGRLTVVAKGLRNPQGVVADPSGRIFVVSHGPRGGDELNLIKDGLNYGWPFVTYGTDYGSDLWPLQQNQGRHEQYVKPIKSWLPSIGPSSINIANAPDTWKGDLLVTGLASQSIHRLRFDVGRIIFEEDVFIGERIRDLIQLEDGSIYLWTDNARLIKLSPANMQVGNRLDEFSLTDRLAGVPDVIAACRECHYASSSLTSLPDLYDIFGSRVASSGFKGYSSGLKGKGDMVWNESNLEEFLRDPAAFAPGTAMIGYRITDDNVRASVIEHLARMNAK